MGLLGVQCRSEDEGEDDFINKEFSQVNRYQEVIKNAWEDCLDGCPGNE